MVTRSYSLVSLLACLCAAIIAMTFAPRAEAQLPNPVTCEGYPEKRVFLESQSWWTDKNHPYPGAHIHWGTCFPLIRPDGSVVVTGPSIHFDVKLQLHDDPGTVSLLRVQIFQDGADPTWIQTVSIRCPRPDPAISATCVMWLPIDVPLDKLPSDGRRELRMTANIGTGLTEPTHCCRMFNTTRWPMRIENGKSDSNYPSTNRIGAAGWYSGVDYTNVYINPDDFPFNPVSGVWHPRVNFQSTNGFASIDPAFHAVPVNEGTVLYEGPGGSVWRTLTIDTVTMKLCNGPHKLFLRTDRPIASGTGSGVFLLPFEVRNPVDSCTP